MTCGLCGSQKLHPVTSLGDIPIAHNLRRTLDENEARFRVDFDLCTRCGLLQIANPIPADLLYDETDTYTTGFQNPPHIPDLVATLLSLATPAAVLEIGCNDGLFMRALRDKGVSHMIGVEPNRHAAAPAIADGLEVLTTYLDADSSRDLTAKHGKFDLVIARHTLEHIGDVRGFFAVLDELLMPGGRFLLELPHVESGFDCGNPVILWEEHVNYFTEPIIESMFRNFGYEIEARRLYAFGGGTIAFIARRKVNRPPEPHWNYGPYDRAYYQRYDKRIRLYRESLRAVLDAARARKRPVAIYGAAPRSCTAINYSGLSGMIDLVIDDRKEIAGRFMPGTGRAVMPLDDIPEKKLRESVFLLGVGAENEGRVLARIFSRTGTEPPHVSLFPPRDTLASSAAAEERIAASPLPVETHQ